MYVKENKIPDPKTRKPKSDKQAEREKGKGQERRGNPSYLKLPPINFVGKEKGNSSVHP